MLTNGVPAVTPLHRAIKGRRVSMERPLYIPLIELLLDHGADVNAENDRERTPLIEALCRNDKKGVIELVQLLLERGANAAHRNTRGSSLLNAIIFYGVTSSFTPEEQVALAESLLKHKADPNIRVMNDCTLLHFAARNGNVELARLLLDYHVDVNARNDRLDTPLYDAFFYWDKYARQNGAPLLGMVELLIERGADVSAINGKDTEFIRSFEPRGSWGFATPLHAAAWAGRGFAARRHNDRAIKSLLERQADVNARNASGVTPLHIALRYCDLTTVKLLLDYHADVSAQYDDGNTALNSFIKGSNFMEVEEVIKTVHLLIDYGAKAYTTNKDGATPLHNLAGKHILLEYKEAEISGLVPALLQNQADINARDNNDNTPLHRAARHRNASLVRFLLEGQADVDAQNAVGNTPLHEAVHTNSDHSGPALAEVVQQLLSYGADPRTENNSGETPLHIAALAADDNFTFYNSMSVLSVPTLLLQRRADVNATDVNGNTPLHIAVTKWLYGAVLVRLLLNHKADTNAKNRFGRTPLHEAVFQDFSQAEDPQFAVSLIRLLLEHQADPTVKDVVGDIPLHLAARNVGTCNLEIFRLLLDHHAGVNARNNVGNTPLYEAIRECHDYREDVSIIMLLLDRGASISALNQEGYTVLHEAVRKVDVELLQFLLDRSTAAINVKNRRGNTPLMIAACNENVECAALLLNRGADLNIANDNGETALGIGCTNGCLEMIYLLARFSPSDLLFQLHQYPSPRMERRKRQKISESA